MRDVACEFACAVRMRNVAMGANLKGLGHAILDNFSTDRMVIGLTKISK